MLQVVLVLYFPDGNDQIWPRGASLLRRSTRSCGPQGSAHSLHGVPRAAAAHPGAVVSEVHSGLPGQFNHKGYGKTVTPHGYLRGSEAVQ